MLIIDSHVHIWTNDAAYPWAAEAIDPPDFEARPESLLKIMEAESIAATVLVQYIGYRWKNDYVAKALKAYPQKFMGVCRVDPEDPAAPEHLSYWTEVHGFHGVRISPEPDARGDWFQGPLMRPFFERASSLNIPIMLLTKPSRLENLLAILEQVPDVDVVIDHFADCKESDPRDRQLLQRLAAHPRVFLKSGHVWANSTMEYPWCDQQALLKYTSELFGVDRIMWGSDWSFCLRRTSYHNALSYIRDEIDFWSPEEMAWVLGKTALRLWKFSFDHPS